MRTTLRIDDDILDTARVLALPWNRPIGSVISELARRGLRSPAPINADEIFPNFVVAPGAPPITSSMVAAALDGP